jgi:hypothetical protein
MEGTLHQQRPFFPLHRMILAKRVRAPWDTGAVRLSEIMGIIAVEGVYEEAPTVDVLIHLEATGISVLLHFWVAKHRGPRYRNPIAGMTRRTNL